MAGSQADLDSNATSSQPSGSCLQSPGPRGLEAGAPALSALGAEEEARAPCVPVCLPLAL